MKFSSLLLRLLFFLLLIIAALALATDAEEGVIPWPGNKVVILDKTGRDESMQAAARIWNSTGINFTINVARESKDADIVAEATDSFSLSCNRPGVVGCASIGKQPSLPWQKPTFQLKRKRPGEGRQMIFTAVAAHEMGHLLGLRHNKKSCALMNIKSICRDRAVDYRLESDCPVLLEGAVLLANDWCPGRSNASIMCGPSLAEVRLLIKRYGGRLNKDYSPYCHSSVKQEWIGWCLYPDWVPSGYKKPWFVKNKCSVRTPVKYLAPLFIAIEQASAQRERLRRRIRESENASGVNYQNGQLIYDNVSRIEKRWRALVPRELRALLYSDG